MLVVVVVVAAVNEDKRNIDHTLESFQECHGYSNILFWPIKIDCFVSLCCFVSEGVL